MSVRMRKSDLEVVLRLAWATPGPHQGNPADAISTIETTCSAMLSAYETAARSTKENITGALILPTTGRYEAMRNIARVVMEQTPATADSATVSS